MPRNKAPRFIQANPDEPRAGDFGYSLYEKLHPVFGDPAEIERVKGELAGLRGERVTIIFNGAKVSDDGETKRFRLQRTFNYRNYRDVFGPGSAYASVLHFARETDSDWELVTYSLTVQVAGEEDEDE